MTLFTSLMRNQSVKNKPCRWATLGIVLVTISAFSSPASAEWIADARAKMGTEVSVYLWHDDAARGAEALEAVYSEVDRINALMSTYVEESRISEVNREAHERWVFAGDELFNLVTRSLDISVLTRGAFDITYDSVGQHYDFRERLRPDAATVEEELDRIDWRLVETSRTDLSIHFAREGVRIKLPVR